MGGAPPVALHTEELELYTEETEHRPISALSSR